MSEIEETFEDNPSPKTLKSKLWNATKLILKIAVAGVLLYFVFKKLTPDERDLLKNRMLHANYWWLLAALLTFFSSMIVSSFRLQSFFRSIGLHLDNRFNFRLYLLGLFYNALLPGGIGGDGYKIYILSKNYKLPGKKVFWAIMFDRLSGLWAIGFIIVCLTFLIPQISEIIHIGIPLTIFLVGSAVYYFVAFKFFREYTKFFFQGHVKAVALQSLQALSIVFILLSQGFSGKFAPYLLSFLVSSLATIIPISVGGAGIRETIFTQLAPFFHMEKSLALYLPLSLWVMSIIIALTGLYYVIRPKRLEEGLPSIEDHTKDQPH
jgi:uncharacterized membrane protein YbhN (UPF0104 family)